MDEKIQWHPAFADALKLELAEYSSILEIEEEHQLTEKPLQIDVIIVKKTKNVNTLKNIAKIFKKHNIIEYKSPTDYLSIDDFYKVNAYAYIYKTNSNIVDSIKIEELTITMVSSNLPKKLIKHLEKLNFGVNNVEEGIYYIDGTILPMQIIVVNELPKKVNRFVRLLTRGLDIRQEIGMLVEDCANDNKNKKYEHLLDIVGQTNLIQLMEVIDMARKLTVEEEQAIDRVVEKFNLKQKWVGNGLLEAELKGKAEGKVEGKVEGKAEVFLKLLSIKGIKLPEETINKINNLKNINLLDNLISNIFAINDIEDLEKLF